MARAGEIGGDDDRDMPTVRQRRRTVIRNSMKASANNAPEQFRAYFLPRTDALFGIVWADALDRECVGHRTAINAILDGLEISNSAAGFWQRMLEAMGARDRADLERTYARGRLAEGADLAQACERAKDLLRRRMESEHDYRRVLLWELFGIRETPPMLEAHTNGNGDH